MSHTYAIQTRHGVTVARRLTQWGADRYLAREERIPGPITGVMRHSFLHAEREPIPWRKIAATVVWAPLLPVSLAACQLAIWIGDRADEKRRRARQRTWWAAP